MNKILFIVEGEKTEKKFCDKIIEKYFLQNQRKKEYVAFKTNIYGLYNELKDDDGLDIVELVKEKVKKQNDIKNYNMLLKGGFSEIYLIFDFELQHPQYSSSVIKKMVSYFDNETEHGKLYNNYPMIESYKHFKSIPDIDYNSYELTKDECLKYKKTVGNISAIKHFGDLTDNILSCIIKQNLNKYEFISNRLITDYFLYQKNFSQLKLLNIQLNHYKISNKIYVFNTILFWGIDYFGSKIYDKYINYELRYKENNEYECN